MKHNDKLLLLMMLMLQMLVVVSAHAADPVQHITRIGCAHGHIDIIDGQDAIEKAGACTVEEVVTAMRNMPSREQNGCIRLNPMIDKIPYYGNAIPN